MSNESIILTLLSIIGCLLIALVVYFVQDVQNKFLDLKGWTVDLNRKFDDHIRDCKFIDKRT